MHVRAWGDPFAGCRTGPYRRLEPQAKAQNAALGRFYGPIKLVELPGKGRGLVLSESVEAGQLVLSSLPVVMVRGSSDTEALLQALNSAKLTPAQQMLLSLAHGYVPPDSTAAAGMTMQQQNNTTPDLRWLHHELQRMDNDHYEQQLLHTGPAAASTAAGITQVANADVMGSSDPTAYSPAMHRCVLELNCASEEEADVMMKLGHSLAKQQLDSNNKVPAVQWHPASTQPRSAQSGPQHLAAAAPAPALDQVSACQLLTLVAAAAAPVEPVHTNKQAGRRYDQAGAKHSRAQRGAEAATSACVGLWVEHAWMNHSCAPNVTNYTLADAMVVRAGSALPAGTELQDTYLGSTLTQPLQVRRTALEAQYGFICHCQRCRCEEAVQAAVPELLPAFTQLQQQLNSSWEPLGKLLLTKGQRAGLKSRKQSRHAGQSLAGRTSQAIARQSSKQQVNSSSSEDPLEDLIQELQSAISSIQQLVATALAHASVRQAVLAVLCPVQAQNSNDQEQQAKAARDMTAGGASGGTHSNAALQHAQCMLLFSVFGVFELLATCRQHQATSLLLKLQQCSNSPAGKAHRPAPHKQQTSSFQPKTSPHAQQQASSSAQQQRTVEVAAAATTAAQACAELAGVVVPGSQLHTATALSAWSAAATYVCAMDNQSGTSSEGSDTDAAACSIDARRHAAPRLAHAQQQLEAALQLRYGPAEVAVPFNSNVSNTNCLEAMLATMLDEL